MLGAVLLGTAAAAHAHPFHASYAEADYKRDAAKLEIAIRCFTDDVEEMLSKRAGKKVTFAHTPAAELDALLLASVQAGFIVKAPGGEPQPLAWVGRELTDKDQQVWLYLECPMPGGIVGARFSHRLLRDTFPDQLNSVRVRDTGPPLRQATLLFPKDSEQTVFVRK